MSFFTAVDFSIFSMVNLLVSSSADLRAFIYTLIWKYVYRLFLINVVFTCIYDHLNCVYFIHLWFLRLVIPRDIPTTTLTQRSARNTDGMHLIYWQYAWLYKRILLNELVYIETKLISGDICFNFRISNHEPTQTTPTQAKSVTRGKTEAASFLVCGENRSDNRKFAWWQPVDWEESKLIPSQDTGKSHSNSVARIRAKSTQIWFLACWGGIDVLLCKEIYKVSHWQFSERIYSAYYKLHRIPADDNEISEMLLIYAVISPWCFNGFYNGY